MTKTYPDEVAISKKWWSKFFLISKWLIVIIAFSLPVITDLSGLGTGIKNAVLWYISLSLFWYIIRFLAYGRKPTEDKASKDSDYD